MVEVIKLQQTLYYVWMFDVGNIWHVINPLPLQLCWFMTQPWLGQAPDRELGHICRPLNCFFSFFPFFHVAHLAYKWGGPQATWSLVVAAIKRVCTLLSASKRQYAFISWHSMSLCRVLLCKFVWLPVLFLYSYSIVRFSGLQVSLIWVKHSLPLQQASKSRILQLATKVPNAF